MIETTYLHVLEGRLRVKVPDVKRSRVKAQKIEAALLAIDGITEVKSNPRTGNVLVFFDSKKLTPLQVISTTRELSQFGVPARLSKTPTHRIAETLVQSALQIALERMLLALV